MKTIKVLSTLFALMLLPFAANATPALQLDCDPCTYTESNDYHADVHDDNLSESEVFTLGLIVTEGGGGGPVDVDGDDFYISIALMGGFTGDETDSELYAIFGELIINGVRLGDVLTQSELLAMVEYGTPPLGDGALDKTPDALSSHGIFDTWYIELPIEWDGPFVGQHGSCEEYDAQYDNQFVNFGTGEGFDSYCATMEIDRSGIDNTIGLHFDFYTLDDNGAVLANAPYSHDVTSVPEPGTLSLLGLGLLALGLGRRRREIA